MNARTKVSPRAVENASFSPDPISLLLDRRVSTNSIDLLAIGRSISALDAFAAKCSELQIIPPGPNDTTTNAALEKAEDDAYVEIDALRAAGSFIFPETLKDVLVQLCFASIASSEITEFDYSDPADLWARADLIQKLLSSAVAVLSQHTGVGIKEIASEWQTKELSRHWPGIELAQLPPVTDAP